MNYREAILWTMKGNMSARDGWHTEDIISRDKDGVEIWTPKCILIDQHHNLVLQVGDSVTPYSVSQEDEKATDWHYI